MGAESIEAAIEQMDANSFLIHAAAEGLSKREVVLGLAQIAEKRSEKYFSDAIDVGSFDVPGEDRQGNAISLTGDSSFEVTRGKQMLTLAIALRRD